MQVERFAFMCISSHSVMVFVLFRSGSLGVADLFFVALLQVFPPVKRGSGPGFLLLEIILSANDPAAECQVLRDRGDSGEVTFPAYLGTCSSLVQLEGDPY